MTSRGPRTLSQAILERLGDLVRSIFTQATVTAVASTAPLTVTVQIPGASTPVPVPRLKSYSAPAVGDVVWLLGPPGSWVCIGALA